MPPEWSASQSADSSTQTPRPMDMKTAVSFMAANSAAPQKWRVWGVPGREHTTKSERRKSSSRSVASSMPKTSSASHFSDAPLLRRRSARIRMPKALHRRAVVWPMSPKPTKPTDSPRSSGITNLSQALRLLFSWMCGTRLLKCSIAASEYSARLEENAPRALVTATPSMRGSLRSTGTSESTPAASEWTHRTPGQCVHSASTTLGSPPAKAPRMMPFT
mmetsp:Transcript_56301/g.151826  ORF Transcript_56301/g.151826 Transcript_56301/m.151826 type:complete len:219 (+) Transcript_56301:282-938(+)